MQLMHRFKKMVDRALDTGKKTNTKKKRTTIEAAATLTSATPEKNPRTPEKKPRKKQHHDLSEQKNAKFIGFGTSTGQRNLKKGAERRRKIADGDKYGYESEVQYAERTKYENWERPAVREWVVNGNMHVKDNPCKGETVTKKNKGK